ncbi:GTP-binding regulatory protein alpha chain - starfish, partial [Reticulomyxa filosa]
QILKSSHQEEEEKGKESAIFDPAQCLEDIHRMLCYDVFDLCACNLREREANPEFAIEDDACRNLIDSIAKDSTVFFTRAKIDKTRAGQIAKIWGCPGIKKTFEYRRKQHVMDNTPYFLDRIEELYVNGQNNQVGAIDAKEMRYVPHWEDYLRIRDQTTGVLTYDIPTRIQNRTWTVRLTDVGGQRSERKKWIKVFNGVNVVIYVMSLSGYDQVIYESVDVRCYDESFGVFQQIVNNSSFETTDFVLFLNKVDLLEEKLKTIPFTCFDPSFNETNDKEKVIKYVQDRFESIWFSESPEQWRDKRSLFFHNTCCLDTAMMQSIIAKVHVASIKRAMRDVGMI